MDFYTASDARQNLFRLIDLVADSHKPICVGGKRNKVIILSAEDYRSLEETVYLCSVPGFVESIEEARLTPREERLIELNWDE